MPLTTKPVALLQNIKNMQAVGSAICFLLYMLYCLVHGVLPNSIMSEILVPLLKDKAGQGLSLDQPVSCPKYCNAVNKVRNV